jgi:CIC family chloride channel protein
MLKYLLTIRTRAQFLFRLSDAHTMLVWTVIPGVAGEFATAAFREGIDELQQLFGGETGTFVAMVKRLPWPVRVMLPAAGGLIAGACLLIARRRATKQAHAHYMEAVTIGDGMVPVWQSLWRSFSSLFTIASGGSIGREGSMVQLAALTASLVGRWDRFDPPRLRLFVACGAAAGITSAYNAPIAGAFFVTEIVLGSIAMESFGPIVVSLVVRTGVDREWRGDCQYAVGARTYHAAWDGLAVRF